MISRDLTARGSWLLAMTLLLLAGCGFHLRGQIEIADSIQPVAITAAAGSPVAAELARRLRSSGIALVSPGGG
jgi:LPS-assembly lipoprotein